ncbi:TonB-dependent siderophore receptor [Bordetella genomosp. 9]|uniref:TonB-dependent siderophore receptor n=1 Tax=Bordetella genomosp. 9 TaxID=1416803 RepID=A0A261RPE2_9BORD|nr:TonB-dependent siderophore receptor [Bordetella genomosp. 9]OZI26916.1 TonB-dependent siderophore receptor [Bordetella genomosp. 9]
MKQLTPIAAAVLALFAAPVAAIAQQAAAPGTPAPATPAAPTATLDTVHVNGDAPSDDFNTQQSALPRLGVDLHDVPQSVTVVNKALMQSQGATSLQDALRNVAGITLGAAEGGTIGNNIYLNGFSARTDIYLDGFRDRAQYYRDTFDLDEVEVLMGPSSMLFGRGSTGGVINQVSKKPKLADFTDVTGSVTTNGLVRSTVDTNMQLSETSAFRFNGMTQNGDATTRDQSHVKDFGAAPSFKFGIGTPTEVTLSALLQHNDDMPDYGVQSVNGHPAGVSRNTAYGFHDDRTMQDIAMLNASVQHKFTPDTVLRNQTQYNNVRTDARETAPQAVGTLGPKGFQQLPAGNVTNLPLDDLWILQQSHDRVIHDESIFNQTELSTKFDTGSIKHTLLTGVELGHDHYSNQAYSRTGTCDGFTLNSGFVGCTQMVDPQHTSADLPEVPGNFATGSANTVGIYANDTVELTKQFKLVGGLRWDRYEATVTNSVPRSTTPANADQTVHYTSVRGGAIWQPSDWQSYYISYGTSFNPSLEQLTATVGQDTLEPEKNRSYEAGGKWDLFDGNLSLNSAVFQIKKENARTQISPGVYELDGTVRVNGVRAGASGHLTRQWQLYAAYTYLDAEITSAKDGTEGNTPANTPKNTFNFWSTYQFLQNWEVGGGAVYTSSRYAANTDAVQVGGYTRWDGTLAWHQPKYDVRLNLFNIFDKKYYDALIPSDGGRAVPGTGRTAMLTVSYHIQ